MYRIALAGLLLLAGCQGVVGPRCRGVVPPRAVANPCLTIPEQREREREYLALPEQSPNLAPRTFAEPPGYFNREH